MSRPLFQLEQFVVGHDGRPVLGALDFSVDAGQIVALTGASGLGKTTLLRAAAGLSDPLEGQVRVRGRTPEETGWPAFRQRVILVSQQPALLDASVEANLRRPFEYREAAGMELDVDAALDWLDHLGVGRACWDRKARSLSVGQQQRVCLIRAMLLDPDVLLLDEPTSSLDEESARFVESAVREQATRHAMAAVVTTHQVDRARRWCDQVIDLAPLRRAAPAA